MRRVYLALTILGAVVPYAFFISHWTAEGFGFGVFVRGVTANAAAAGFTADLVISSLAFWLLLVQDEAERIWLFVGLNLAIGLSCAVPAYLFWREGRKAGSPSP